MSRTQITEVHQIVRGGLSSTSITPQAADVANGNYYANGPTTWVSAKNTDTVSRTVTVTPTQKVDGYAVTATPHTLAAGETLELGPFPADAYGAAVQVNASNAAVTFVVKHL